MQIPILNGIFADADAEFRSSYPINLVPIPKQQGISTGYLRPADGIVQNGTGPGKARGGIEWNGICYRVLGTKLVSIAKDGAVTVIGDVGGGGPVSMTYSFDLLAVASGGKLYYYDGVTLKGMPDQDLGEVLDVIWVDGYFVTTDGEFIVVTELNDPNQVDPLKYGSSEVNPDPINSLVKIRNEVYAVNRFSIEAFSNVGGSGFPFQRITGAQVTRGAIGTHAATEFNEALAFVGGGQNESLGVFLATGGNAVKISTREIDYRLAAQPEDELPKIVVERFADKSNQTLIIHLSDGTICYDAAASAALQQPVWYEMQSGVSDPRYLGRYLVWCYNEWLVADHTTSRVGKLSRSVYTHWGQHVRWQFGTPIMYNEAKGGIIHGLELVSLTGSGPLGNTAKISMQYSDDGVNWSQPKFIAAGREGDRAKRLRWVRQGMFRQRRMFRFTGDSSGPISPARLEAEIEGMAW